MRPAQPAWRNPFTSSKAGGRALSALMLPSFLIRPPAGYGVLTTTGRRTGKRRRRCLRMARSGDDVYLVAIKGAADWVWNARANPDVRVRVPGGTFSGRVRELHGAAEIERAADAFCKAVHGFDYLTWINWRTGRPTRTKIQGLLRDWFEEGVTLVVELPPSR